MLDWLRRHKTAPLKGVPAVRRMKTYSAAGGYVYHYFYEGQRAGPEGTEFVFSVSPDSRNYQSITVLVHSRALDDWRALHARSLEPNECYAASKMGLFQMFDEAESPDRLSRRVQVRFADLQAILETLGIE